MSIRKDSTKPSQIDKTQCRKGCYVLWFQLVIKHNINLAAYLKPPGRLRI